MRILYLAKMVSLLYTEHSNTISDQHSFHDSKTHDAGRSARRRKREKKSR